MAPDTHVFLDRFEPVSFAVLLTFCPVKVWKARRAELQKTMTVKDLKSHLKKLALDDAAKKSLSQATRKDEFIELVIRHEQSVENTKPVSNFFAKKA